MRGPARRRNRPGIGGANPPWGQSNLGGLGNRPGGIGVASAIGPVELVGSAASAIVLVASVESAASAASVA